MAFVEREAARFFNYTLGDWKSESVHVRAEVIAHYMEKNTRDGYAWDQAEKNKGDAADGTPKPSWADLQRFRQGGGK